MTSVMEIDPVDVANGNAQIDPRTFEPQQWIRLITDQIQNNLSLLHPQGLKSLNQLLEHDGSGDQPLRRFTPDFYTGGGRGFSKWIGPSASYLVCAAIKNSEKPAWYSGSVPFKQLYEVVSQNYWNPLLYSNAILLGRTGRKDRLRWQFFDLHVEWRWVEASPESSPNQPRYVVEDVSVEPKGLEDFANLFAQHGSELGLRVLRRIADAQGTLSVHLEQEQIPAEYKWQRILGCLRRLGQDPFDSNYR